MKKTNSEHVSFKKNIPSDGTRFGFLNRASKGFNNVLQKVNMILHEVADSKPYTIDYQEVEKQYLELGYGDIDEFSSSYTLGWAMLNDFINDNVIKQAVYEEVRTYLWENRENSNLS